MSFNPQFDAIGQAFVKHYYLTFDNPQTRAKVVEFYNATESFMTFEGEQYQGAQGIMTKLTNLTFQQITHNVTTADCQPTSDGGVLVSVLGQLKTDEDRPHSFTQTFILKPSQNPPGSFFIAHDIFRLSLHHG